MHLRTVRHRQAAIVVGTIAAAVSAVRLSGWPVRLDVYDPMLNRGFLTGMVEPIANQYGVAVAAGLVGVVVGLLVFAVAPVVFDRPPRSD